MEQNFFVCGEDEYRSILFDKFKTAALMALLVNMLQKSENATEERETLIKTWREKISEDRQAGLEQIMAVVSTMEEEGQEVPQSMRVESLEEQDRYFRGIIQEMSCEIRSMLNDPKEGGV